MSEYIAKGKTAYVKGELVIGKMKVMTGQEITTKGASIDIPGGAYAEGDIVIKGDSDLTPDNIKSGVLIFGVQGTYTAEEPKSQETARHIADTLRVTAFSAELSL
jgi:formylmethanofuran dehydrogenase subunit C